MSLSINKWAGSLKQFEEPGFDSEKGLNQNESPIPEQIKAPFFAYLYLKLYGSFVLKDNPVTLMNRLTFQWLPNQIDFISINHYVPVSKYKKDQNRLLKKLENTQRAAQEVIREVRKQGPDVLIDRDLKKDHLGNLTSQSILEKKIIKNRSDAYYAQKAEECLSELEDELPEAVERVKPLLADFFSIVVYTKINDVYLNSLDAYPYLHPQFQGSHLPYQATLITRICSDFSDSISNPRHRALMLSTAIKLQNALSFEKIKEQILAKEFIETTEDLGSLSAYMKNSLQRLEIEDSCVFFRHVDRHAILFEFVRESERNYIFTIINTGEDESCYFTRISRLWDSFLFFRYYEHKSYRLEIASLTADIFAQMISNKAYNVTTAEYLFELDALFMQGGKVSRVPGRLHQPQGRENCPAKSISSWMRGECIRRLGNQEGSFLFIKFKQFLTQRLYQEAIEALTLVSRETAEKIYGCRPGLWDAASSTSRGQLSQELARLKEAVDERMDAWAEKAASLSSSLST